MIKKKDWLFFPIIGTVGFIASVILLVLSLVKGMEEMVVTAFYTSIGFAFIIGLGFAFRPLNND